MCFGSTTSHQLETHRWALGLEERSLIIRIGFDFTQISGSHIIDIPVVQLDKIGSAIQFGVIEQIRLQQSETDWLSSKS